MLRVNAGRPLLAQSRHDAAVDLCRLLTHSGSVSQLTYLWAISRVLPPLVRRRQVQGCFSAAWKLWRSAEELSIASRMKLSVDL